ncbi:NADH-quinone oxidoreductase subunit NuoH [Peredibacter starrii]|uniref:NADH-quinone oxidoreductase subunit H n=1 Tax=Peredibacter starrii TaxID=28202 RepID=A0AAX4HS59_9BACT|nr:NADH-quinone oxidoreductase subunit NuoH [Peredibacter starrii]WPU66169.1 NADH-quinone oxidoreductase subunit NuoH [Peredibacter starrii]
MEYFDFIQLIAKILFVVAVCLSVVPVMVWFERRGSAWMQGRVGPNRVGPFGLLQPLADVFKFFCKEDFTPGNANKFYYYLAPMVALIAPLCALAVIPFGSKAIIMGQEVNLQIGNFDSGVIFILAFAGLEVYPLILAGWASKNKYSVLGALRGSSQIVSYEIAMGLALLSMMVVYGSFNPHDMVSWQQKHYWGALINPIGALVFWISIFAETNRLPFDLPEGESEIVAGYHLEYGAMKFALFFMAEYVAMIMASALIATLFFGGYGILPGMSFAINMIVEQFGWGEVGLQNTTAVFEFLSFFTKVAVFMFIFVWVRWTLPRFRFDQLMDLGWKILFPLSLINLVAVTLGVYFLNQ